MKAKKACLSVLLSVLAATSVSAQGRGGMKDYASGVPVPAPVPVHETFRWYVRADLGLGIVDEGGMSERGLRYGATDSIAPFGFNSSWFASDTDTFVSGGVGAGLYLSPRLRGDVTIDWRTANEVEASGIYSYPQFNLATAPPAATGNTVRGTVNEHNTLHSTLGLVNLYWDLTERGWFTPYVGIGGGFVLRHVDRRHNETVTVLDPTGAALSTTTFGTSNKSAEVGAAGALMAGASLAVSPGVLIDVNYRFTYLGSAETTMPINGVLSRLTVGDTHEHALRAGLRWNVW